MYYEITEDEVLKSTARITNVTDAKHTGHKIGTVPWGRQYLILYTQL